MSPSLLAMFAQDDGVETGRELFLLGDDFMPWMVLAFGAAMVAGNVLALVRPPRRDSDPTRTGGSNRPATSAPERPPVVRSLVMIAVGLVAGGWGLASLVSN